MTPDPHPDPSAALADPAAAGPEALAARLGAVLDRLGPLRIAVSGGIDSMMLAHAAQRRGAGASMVHAVSPAVPPAATARVRRLAEAEGWDLAIVDAGEFADPDYRANPVKRCYFCKASLYDRLAALGPGRIASGANTDDLGDFRPGLAAAAERQVVHPWIEAGIGKAGIRALARAAGLTDLAELPAQPCLASRVETGIAIDAGDLAFVDRVEEALRGAFGPAATVRARVTRAGIVVETAQGAGPAAEVSALAGALCAQAGRVFVGVRPYRRGAAFLLPDGSPAGPAG